MRVHKMTMTKLLGKPLGKLLQATTAIGFLFASLLIVTPVANAAELLKSADNISTENASVLDYLTDKDGKYTGPTVEDNILAMDSDKNGFADVFEVRAFLVLKHGKDYQKDLLDKWEASASGKSCSTPFAKELVTDKNYTNKTN
ncbi:hypothetical protein [Methylotenera sp. 73s]|uniref:hypothetical protein n=2 Tax=Methylotenera TaxID=359407 RepID=UPI00039ECA51